MKMIKKLIIKLKSRKKFQKMISIKSKIIIFKIILFYKIMMKIKKKSNKKNKKMTKIN